MSGLCALYQRSVVPCDQRAWQQMELLVWRRGDVLLRWQQEPVRLVQALWQEQQPAHWPLPGEVQVAADAHLYYREALGEQLRARGMLQGPLPSDLDLIALSYRCWGARCVEHLEGDYAFVLWDGREQTLFAARSPLGVRPLFYRVSSTDLLFASDAAILLADPSLGRALDPNWVALYLTTGHQQRGTIFREIEELPAGATLTFTERLCRITRFWPPSLPAPLHYRDRRDYAAHLRSLLEQAVHERMRDAGRTVLLDLSGGLDSSTIAALAATHAAPPPLVGVHFSSAQFAEKDERPYAHLVAQAAGIPLKVWTEQEAPVLADLQTPRTVEAVPHAALLLFGRWYRLLGSYGHSLGARGYLRGTFGDQLFLPSWQQYHWHAWQERRYGLLLQDLWQRHRQGEAWTSMLSTYLLGPALRRSAPSQDRRSLAPWIRSGVWQRQRDLQEQEERELRRLCPYPFYREVYRWMLRYTEYATLHASRSMVEAGLACRDPYTDPRLIRFVLSCPPAIQVRPGETKGLLREATRELLPEAVRTRSTKGRIARVLFTGIHRQAPLLHDLVCQAPECLSPFLDTQQFAQELLRSPLMPCHQPSLFSTLSLVLWAHQMFQAHD